jgi:hypothetical protein
LPFARAYEGLGRNQDADEAFRFAADRVPGLEAGGRYVAFMAKTGRREDAEIGFAEIERRLQKIAPPLRPKRASGATWPPTRLGANRSNEGTYMGFKCGIVGLPNVGKSTLFNALTKTAAAQAANYPFCTIEPNVGEVAMPEPRLGNSLGKIAGSKEIIPTRMNFVDIAGLVRGASKGEGLGQPIPRQHPRVRRHRLRAALLRE